MRLLSRVLFLLGAVIFFSGHTQDVDQPKCGDVAVDRIDLSRQFGPTRCQGKDGICYSYSAVGAVEAALYRSDGEHRFFDEGYAAVLSSLHKRDLASRANSVLSSTDNKDKTRVFDGGHPISVVRAIQDSRLAVRRDESAKHLWKRIQVGKDDLSSVKTEKGEVYTGEMFAKDAKLFIKHSSLAVVPKSDQEKLKQIKIETFSVAPYLASAPSDKDPPFSATSGCPSSADSLLRWKRVVDGLTQALCDGLPIVTGFQARESWYSDGVQSPRRRIESDGRHAFHSNLITGLKKMDFGDGKGPRWTFEMRESWGEGTQEQPKGSVSYLPYDEVCRLFEAFVVVGPWDRHAMRSKSLDTQRQCTVVMGKTIECSNVELSPEPVGSTQPEKPTHK